jgi:hypothetical protein
MHERNNVIFVWCGVNPAWLLPGVRVHRGCWLCHAIDNYDGNIFLCTATTAYLRLCQLGISKK